MSQRKHGLSHTPEYRAWQTMRLRCLNPKNAAFKNYGGRGIMVCDIWQNDVLAFLRDMGPKPTPKHELDRIENDGHYEPTNCRWVTRTQNDRNRRTNVFLTYQGERLTIAEWCERTGLRRDTVRKRLVGGWATEKALSTPARYKAPAKVRRLAA